MHRVESADPRTDTRLKMAAARPRGRVLDCCTGLGYTAIAAARRPEVERVLTVDKDRNVLLLARQNPPSRELFESPKIEPVVADTAAYIRTLADAAFDTVIHDPPRLAMAGELYGEAFYRELLRVLKPGGRLYHYTGAPGRAAGKDIPGGVMRRLQAAGFARVRRVPWAQGVVAVKPKRQA
jgi:predicted methyltransferase